MQERFEAERLQRRMHSHDDSRRRLRQMVPFEELFHRILVSLVTVLEVEEDSWKLELCRLDDEYVLLASLVAEDSSHQMILL